MKNIYLNSLSKIVIVVNEKVKGQGQFLWGVTYPEMLKIAYLNSLSKAMMVFIEKVKGQGQFLWGSTFQCPLTT